LKIEINRNWWLKWYWPFYETIYKKEGHYGTRQSAKSHNVARKLIYHTFKPYQFNVIHARKVYADIDGSTFALLTSLVNRYFPDDFKILKSHHTLINKHTGNWFRGLGMDKPEKAKAVEGANIAWMEEANQFDLQDYHFIDTTIRAEADSPISIIKTWNPESAEHWLKKEVDKFSDDPDCLYHKSSFWDNYKIDREALHEKLLTIKDGNGWEGEQRYRVWALGEWGIEDPSSLFAKEFNEEIHVFKGSIKAKPELDLILSFDFNGENSGGNTCLVGQIDFNPPDKKYWAEIRVLKVYRIADLEVLCQTILAEFPGLFYVINGDASGGFKSALTLDNKSAFQLIQNYLNVSNEQVNVAMFNLSHISTKLHTNLVLKKSRVLIAKNDFHGETLAKNYTMELVGDLKSAKVDSKRSLDTWKKENPKKGHCLDSWRYFISTNCSHISKVLELEK
jgi:hypothetical protein